jgi:ParB family chromosome partitioning protein
MKQADQDDAARRVISIPVDKIVIGQGRRGCDGKALLDLAFSLRTIGLINPVTVTQKGEAWHLHTGLHRLESAKLLGWESIECQVFDGDQDTLRLSEIAENVFRKNLSALEEAEQIAEYQTCVTKKGAQLEHPGGNQPHYKGISKAAKDLNISRTRVQRANKIAGLDPAVKDALKTAGFADNQKYLLDVAEVDDPDRQLELVASLKEKVARRKARKLAAKTELKDATAAERDADAINRRDADFEHLKDEWADIPQFVEALTEACPAARELFVDQVLMPLLRIPSAKEKGAVDEQ